MSTNSPAYERNAPAARSKAFIDIPNTNNGQHSTNRQYMTMSVVIVVQLIVVVILLVICGLLFVLVRRENPSAPFSSALRRESTAQTQTIAQTVTHDYGQTISAPAVSKEGKYQCNADDLKGFPPSTSADLATAIDNTNFIAYAKKQNSEENIYFIHAWHKLVSMVAGSDDAAIAAACKRIYNMFFGTGKYALNLSETVKAPVDTAHANLDAADDKTINVMLCALQDAVFEAYSLVSRAIYNPYLISLED